jgi:hypothetical protein
VQLEGVDALQAQLGRPDRGQPDGPAGLVELVQQRRVGGFELDRVAVGLKAGGVASLGAADQVEAPLDQDERHDPSKRGSASTLPQQDRQEKPRRHLKWNQR